MSTVTDHWLANILMSPPPRPTAFDVVPGTSRSQVAEPIPHLLPHQEQPAYLRRIADALVRGQSQQQSSRPIDEALTAQQAREAAAAQMQRAVRPPGGRPDGPLMEFAREMMLPQSPSDLALYALTGPFKPAVKAGLLGLGLAMDSSPAQAAPLRRLFTRGAERGAGTGGPVGTSRPVWLQPEELPPLPGLPMDPGSVFGRQHAMRFEPFMPLGHGTGGRFTAFDSGRRGSHTGSPQASHTWWTEVNPRLNGIADEFAIEAAQKFRGTPYVMPLIHRSERRGEISLTGRESRDDIRRIMDESVREHWGRGYDALIVNNYTSPGGRKGTILGVRDGAQLRFPWAYFDPARKLDSTLTYGLGGAIVLPSMAGQWYADQDANPSTR